MLRRYAVGFLSKGGPWSVIGQQKCALSSSGSGGSLIQKSRSRWPLRTVVSNEQDLPPRTVPDHILSFALTSTFDHGTGIYFPHMKQNPADFKVAMSVSVDDLGLSDSELSVFLQMVGPRFNTGKRTVKLTSDRFPHRIENKRFLVVLLEKLLAEARRLDASDLDKSL